MIQKHHNSQVPCPSELRFDPVSKDWVLIATGRAKRPETFIREKRKSLEDPKAKCPFCKIDEQEKPVLILPKNHREKSADILPNDWQVVVFPNKFPAFAQCDGIIARRVGPFKTMQGTGLHEVVVSRDHKRSMAQFTHEEARLLIEAYQERYLDLMNEKFVRYVSIFHNHGREAGASIAHPHSQIIAMPIIDPDLQNSLDGSHEFYKRNRRCVHCVMIDFDKKDGQRIIFENKHFIAVCPFASRVAFEIRIYPKKHKAYFERVTQDEKDCLAECLRTALLKLDRALGDPAYNFFIHTAPCDGKNYDHYHWHFEIFPKTSTWAGFELGTGIEISTIEPEKAAEFLREN